MSCLLRRKGKASEVSELLRTKETAGTLFLQDSLFPPDSGCCALLTTESTRGHFSSSALLQSFQVQLLFHYFHSFHSQLFHPEFSLLKGICSFSPWLTLHCFCLSDFFIWEQLCCLITLYIKQCIYNRKITLPVPQSEIKNQTYSST